MNPLMAWLCAIPLYLWNFAPHPFKPGPGESQLKWIADVGMSIEQEVMVIYAGTKGYLDDVPLSKIDAFQTQFLAYVDSTADKLRSDLAEKKDLTDDLEKQLKDALTAFKSKAWKA